MVVLVFIRQHDFPDCWFFQCLILPLQFSPSFEESNSVFHMISHFCYFNSHCRAVLEYTKWIPFEQDWNGSWAARVHLVHCHEPWNRPELVQSNSSWNTQCQHTQHRMFHCAEEGRAYFFIEATVQAVDVLVIILINLFLEVCVWRPRKDKSSLPLNSRKEQGHKALGTSHSCALEHGRLNSKLLCSHLLHVSKQLSPLRFTDSK